MSSSVPEFEFESPSDSPYHHHQNQPNDSPADLFFIKGRLVPHVFKVHDKTKNGTTKRCSSLNSDSGGDGKESMISWSSGKATFVNRRSTSARTCSTENTERNLQENVHVLSGSTNYVYGPSQKLQFLAPAPVSNNKKKLVDIRVVDYLEVKERKGRKSGFRQRLFWLFCLPVET